MAKDPNVPPANGDYLAVERYLIRTVVRRCSLLSISTQAHGFSRVLKPIDPESDRFPTHFSQNFEKKAFFAK